MKHGDRKGEGETPHPFSFEMPPFDPQRAKRPSAFVGIPEAFLVLIGHVIGAWSQFDMAFNWFLKALLVADGSASERWERKSFKKRSILLWQACQVRFASHSSILRCVDELISDAKRLQTDRNLIAHGHILIKMQTFDVVDNQIQGALSLYCVGIKEGKTIEREYSLEELEQVRYEFAYLCGRMNALCKGEHLQQLQIALSDMHALQSLLGIGSSPSPS
jgi:hypothetical protein